MGALVVLVLTVTAGALHAQGEAGAQCLIIPPSARANALGQCYVAIADDATGSWWNPGGLAFVNVAVDLMHSQLVPELASDVNYEYLGGVAKIGGLGTVGGSLIFLTYGKWEGTDQNNASTGTFSSWEIAPTLSGAVKVFDNLGVGMNLKFIYIDLAPASATVEKQAGRGHSIALDLGGLWKVPDFKVFGYKVSRLNLGLCVSNIGPAISFVNVDQAASLPRNLRAGLAYTPYSDEVGRVTVAAEFDRPLVEFTGSHNTYHVGAEFAYIDLIMLRVGYLHDRDGNIMDPTYGLGFSFNKIFRLDWASVPQAKELGRVNRWSLGITF
jgi:hypothetical protein